MNAPLRATVAAPADREPPTVGASTLGVTETTGGTGVTGAAAGQPFAVAAATVGQESEASGSPSPSESGRGAGS